MGLYRNISRSQLFRLASLNSVGVFLKMAAGIVSAKVTALFLGPSGVALIGNMRNFAASLETMSTFGFQNGVIRSVAASDNPNTLRALLSTVFFTVTPLVVVLSAGLFLFSGTWNELVFGQSADYGFIFRFTAVLLPFYAFSFLVLAVLNGLKKFRNVIWATMAGNVVSLILTVLLIWKYHTEGALYAVILAPSFLGLFCLYLLNKEIRLFQFIAFAAFDRSILRLLLSFSAMAFFSAVVNPAVFLAIRQFAIAHIGLKAAGYWTTMDLISNYYFLFLSTLLTVYFFPRLSAATDEAETSGVIREFFFQVIPVFAIGLSVLYFIRFWVIQLLFSKEFLPVSDLFGWQVIGDILKAASLILGYNLLARQKIAVFIITECISLCIMFFGGRFLMLRFGIEGVVMAHVATYTVYIVLLLLYFRKTLLAR